MNVIFDLGGVVVTWDPNDFVRKTVKNKKKQHVLRSEIVDHSDWIALDRGTLSLDEAIRRGAERTGLPESEIERLLEAVPPFLMPVPGSIQLVKDLKKNGNKLFILSNLHVASINYLEKKQSFLELFDGKVISCHINKVKPEPDIYQHLLDRYKLKVAETVFIDDMEENVKVASDLGMKAIIFENPEQCRRELENLGCSV